MTALEDMTTNERRVLWITGAGSGMGRASAVRAASNGWAVALTGRRVDALEETASLVRAAGGDALVAAADITDTAALADAYAGVEAWGTVTALVLAAGLNSPKRAWANQELPEFARIVDTNLVATAAAIQLALPALRAARGVVVVVSSVSGWRFSPIGGVAYSASKFGLASLCETLNAQEGENGVRACNLCPGDVDSDFLQLRPEVPDAEARKRMLTPDDIADAIEFVLDAPPHVRINELVITPR
jgi:NADP-dependent 3-hydroxy acid dehydrogenase YdfG